MRELSGAISRKSIVAAISQVPRFYGNGASKMAWRNDYDCNGSAGAIVKMFVRVLQFWAIFTVLQCGTVVVIV